MLTVPFHAFGWDCPSLFAKVDFCPACPACLVASRCGQAAKLKSAGRYAVKLAKIRHEDGHCIDRHCRMRLLLCRRGENVFKMIAPTRRILAFTELMHACPIQHGLDSSLQSLCRHWNVAPQWSQKRDDGRRVDCLDVQITKHGTGTVKRFTILPRMLCALECRSLVGKVSAHTFGKRHGAGAFFDCRLYLR